MVERKVSLNLEIDGFFLMKNKKSKTPGLMLEFFLISL